MELPLIIINVQRGGPSTGLPTKTEQSDFNIALFGRHGECPIPVIAARSPGDCFYTAIEAARIAIKFMTPVILLSDGYLANGSEPWKVPQFEDLEKILVTHPTHKNNGEPFLPYARDEHLARPWALPGTPGLEHRVGGLEKDFLTGDVSYDPLNHERMVEVRAQKVSKITEVIPPTEILGDESGGLLVIGWGGTYGSITTAVLDCRKEGLQVSAVHLRYLNPLPSDLGEIAGRFDRTLMPEWNCGQLRRHLQGVYVREFEGLNKVQGKPFLVSEIMEKIHNMIGERVSV